MRKETVKQFYTYLHCKPNGDPFYVGKGNGKRSHDFTCGRNQHHKNIVAKYGKENIGVFVFDCDSEAQALADEVQQIAQLKAEGYELCNMSSGGDGGATGLIRGPQSKEHKAKAAAARSKTTKGRPGKPQTPEAIAKIKAARAKQVMPPISEETREKLRVASNGRNIGRTPWNKGKQLSAEHISKLSAAKIGNTNAVGHDGSGAGRPKKSKCE